MPKNNWWIAALAVMLVVAGLGGFLLLETSPAGPPVSSGNQTLVASPTGPAARTTTTATAVTGSDRARLTGYASSTIFGQQTGAVSVGLQGASAARLDRLVGGLPPVNSATICAENWQIYQLTFTAVAGASRGFSVTGYGCGGLVMISTPGKPVSLRFDRDNALLAAVRRLLPASAVATQGRRPESGNRFASSPRKSASARKYGVMVVRSAYSSGPWRPSPPMPKMTASVPR